MPTGCPPCLPAGEYWLDFNFAGATFYPPVTPRAAGPDATPDAMQFNAVWTTIIDTGGDGQTEDLAFILEGAICSATPVTGTTWGNIKSQY
jgi:hypothetical protein